jgi:CBS domain containing-hemolysin-like protein
MVWLNTGLLLLLASASGLLAAVEAAFYLVRRRRLSHIALQNPRAELVNNYLEDPPSLLMPIHMGTYTAHVGMTVVIASMLLERLEGWAMLVAFLSMVGYLLIFRLTLPYALVRRNPERSLLLLLPVFDSYARALAPLVRYLRKRAAPERAQAQLDDPPSTPPDLPPPPVHDADERRLVDSLVRFSETPVRDVMTPRPDLVAVSAASTVAELKRVMRETKYSRIPIYGESLDDMVGVAEVRDLLDHEGSPEEPVKSLARPVYLAPVTKKIAELLRELQAQRTTFAVVIDEYGGTAGVVSIEDIVEELVGEIKDEFDVETEPIAVQPDGSLMVAGRVRLERVEKALEASLQRDGAPVDTVGGLVTAIFGRVPRAQESVEYKDFILEVVDAERKRVNRVRFRRLPPEP